MNNTTLHHTIRNRTKSRLFLVKQRIERILFQLEELDADCVNAEVWGDASELERALAELMKFRQRLKDDTELERSRLIEDGYSLYGERMIVDIDCLNPEGDYQFLPVAPDPLYRVFYLEKVEVWERKAVQS